MKKIRLLFTILLSGCAAQQSEPYQDPVVIQRYELDGYILKARAKAREYAEKKHINPRTAEVPAIRVVSSEEELNAIKPKDADKMNRVQCGLCDYKTKTLYVLNMDYEVLAHEFGHWYFGEDESRADDFAWFFCQREKVTALPILNR